MTTLKSKVLSALRWTAAARISAQLITWVATIYVIRLLDPADYGLMAMSEFFFSLLLLLSSRGFGTALVQAEKVTERQIRQIYGAVLLVNGALLVAQWFGAPVLAAYYEEPRIVPVTRVLALGFVFVSLQTIPEALLSRDIDFKRKSIVDFSATMVSVACVLAMAISGMGVWSLVTGRLVHLGVQAVGLNVVRRVAFRPLFSFGAARRIIIFGGVYTATSLLWFLYSRADVFVAGRVLDTRSVGIYSVGMHLASLVLVKVMPLLNQVALPAYSRIQKDPDAVGQYFVKVVRLMCLLSFPAFSGLAAVAPEFVRVFLGPRYEEAILPLILLCILMPMNVVSTLYPAAIMGMGRPRVEFGNMLFGLIVMPLAFLVGAHYGTVGLCVAWLVAFPFVLLFQATRARPVIHVGFRDLAQAALPPVGASLGMVGAVLLVKQAPLDAVPAAARLGLYVLVGVVSYGSIVWTLFRGRLREVRRILLDRG